MSESNAPDAPDADDLGRLYHAARQPAPPPVLGEQIREAARDALRAPASTSGWRWRHGLALAAVVVLSASILLLLPREELERPDGVPLEAPAVEDTASPSLAPALEMQEAEPISPFKREAFSDEGGRVRPPEAPRRRQAPAEEAARDRGTSGAASSLQRAPERAGELAEDADAGGAAAPGEGLERSYYRSSPELWISHIERLLSEGRFADAEREFEAFRERHPAHPFAQR